MTIETLIKLLRDIEKGKGPSVEYSVIEPLSFIGRNIGYGLMADLLQKLHDASDPEEPTP